MSIGSQTCDIAIPGYVLTERIGSGGYAEVWRAEAPGGIEKAVKVVYGYYDDELAAQELKALERIKGVRHPFLVSLERFEVVSGRLAILTELADMSLEDRRRECRAEGQKGIPREELLRYMADAAEALDFLSQRHSLLHLDIKPENLLILGDHIKVADFGLVKELATRTQNSLVSGMTPTYASPEMFDDEPSAQSDQYSLAIVYQEMLVGTLPFPGRTPAQLAKQHTQAEPQLLSLPASDRPIVARALAKKSADRFTSCRAFVDALSHRPEPPRSVAPREVPQPAPAIPQSPQPSADDTTPPSLCTTLRRPVELPTEERGATVTQPVQRAAQVPAAEAEQAAPVTSIPEEVTDVPVPDMNAELSRQQATLYIAIGGVGIQVLRRLRAMIASREAPDDPTRTFDTIALDTDRDELREASSARWPSPFSSDDMLHLPLRLPKSYDNAREILSWVSRRWLYNIPRSLETRGYRPLGRVALVDHAERAIEFIDRKLERLSALAVSEDESHDSHDKTIRVVLIAGTGGGTGGGIAIDVANATRALAAGRNVPVEVHGYFVCTCLGSNNSSPLLAANTYALLTELNHATTVGNEPAGGRSEHAQSFESPSRPFDFVYWLPARARTRDAKAGTTLDVVAHHLSLENAPEVRAVLRTCRTSPTPRENSDGGSFTIRKVANASLSEQKRNYVSELAAELAAAIKQNWLAFDKSEKWESLVRAEQKAVEARKAEAAAETNAESKPTPTLISEVTPLALRARFKEYMSLEFASEIVRQIRRQLEARDDRGRPVLLDRDAKLIADTARTVIATFVERAQTEPQGSSRFDDSPVLRPLIAASSRRFLSHVVEKFDFKQPERLLRADTIDELLASEAHTILQEALAKPELAVAITSLMDLDDMTGKVVENATIDLFQCGCDRRSIILVPKGTDGHDSAVEKLKAERPHAAVVPADVDDIHLVSEDSGISARSLAAGLERVFPDIAEAARRLLTRIDIEWKSLI